MSTATLIPDRATFRQAVADVAAKAKAILPVDVNGRIESAIKLVLALDVTPQADGSIDVGSSSDPLKTYRLVGTTCTCQDFERGQAPGGWCQHRLAAGIAKRVQEVLTLQAVPPALQGPAVPREPYVPPPALPEAPASANVHLIIDGRQVQLTLRDIDEGRLLQRLQTVLEQYPAPAPTARPEGWCPVHNMQMKETTKDGRSWWSHRHEGQWCKGKGGRS